MATKEETSSTATEIKTEETPDNSTTEDAPTSLETIPEGNVARNELQTAPKDKSKSTISSLFTILQAHLCQVYFNGFCLYF